MIKNTASRCPEGFESIGSQNYQRSCYFVDSSFVTFDEAKAICKARDAKLVTINSEYEQSSLVAFLFLNKNVQGNVWLGARRLPKSSKSQNSNSTKFLWLDGTIMGENRDMSGNTYLADGQVMYKRSYGRRQYVNWAKNQPDNWSNLGEDCLEMISPRSEHLREEVGKWNDKRCSGHRLTVCETNSVRPEPQFEISGECDEHKNVVYY